MDSPANTLLATLTKQGHSTQTHPEAAKLVQRTLLQAEDSFATPLFLLVVDRYGVAVLDWSPETIRLELEQDFQLRLPKVTLDKIMCAITIVTTNYFYKDVTRFVEMCNILAGDDFQPDEFEPADAAEMLIGITEALLLWPPDEDVEDTEFSDEIREYMRQVLGQEGILNPFDVLRLAFSSDESAKVDATFADDPEMYAAIYSTQQTKTEQLRQVYQDNMATLLNQLQRLPLQHGSTERAVTQLRTLMQQTAT